MQLFERGEPDRSIDSFIALDVNPAKVVALYPPSVSGRLSVPHEKWIELFGGTPPSVPEMASTREDNKETLTSPVDGAGRGNVFAGRLRTGLDMLIASSTGSTAKDKDSDTASIAPPGKKDAVDTGRRALESLLRYLPDRRQKVTGALATLNITASTSPPMPALSEAPLQELFDLPDLPPSQLVPAQLGRVAQIVYTALFKAYLVVRPSMVGPLCRIENWCEIAEVEEALRAREVCQLGCRIDDIQHGADARGVDFLVCGEENACASVGAAQGVC